MSVMEDPLHTILISRILLEQRIPIRQRLTEVAVDRLPQLLTEAFFNRFRLSPTVPNSSYQGVTV